MPELSTELRKSVIYLAGPYRDHRGPFFIYENVLRARAIAFSIWKLGFPVVCPHANSFLSDGMVPDDFILAGYLEILRRCDVMVVWETHNYHGVESSGVQAEIAEAIDRGIPVLTLDRFMSVYADFK